MTSERRDHELLEIQERRWSEGDYVSVERLLIETGNQNAPKELIADLLCNERLLREELTPGQQGEYYRAEFERRFPELHDIIARQADLDAALSKFGSFESEPHGQIGTGSHDQLPAAVTIPGFEDLVEFDHGAYGTIYRGWQIEPRREVAVKMLRSDREVSAVAVQIFATEASRLAGLRHANIVPVFSASLSEGRPYFSMPFIAGGNLKQKVTEFAGKPKETARLVATIADALQAAHSLAILHGDLKPGNILLDENGPLVADFGMATRLRSLVLPVPESAPTGRTLSVYGGTPEYMAPEQWEMNAAGPTTMTDVYGLGAVLFELLTGTPPGVKSGWVPPDETRLRQRTVPADLAAICLKCLKKEPTDRYRTASDLAVDLRRFLGGFPVAATNKRGIAGWMDRTAKWARRQPVAALLAALVVLTTIVSLAFYQRISRQRSLDSTVALVDQLSVADPSQLREIIERLSVDPHREHSGDILSSRLAAATTGDPRTILALRLALLERRHDESQVAPLREVLLTADPAVFPIIRDLLGKQHREEMIDSLWAAARVDAAGGSKQDDERRSLDRRHFLALCGLAAYAPDDARWGDHSSFVAQHLLSLPTAELIAWRRELDPARKVLQSPLLLIFESSEVGSTPRQFAAETLADFARDNGSVIAEAILTADPTTIEYLLPVAKRNMTETIARLREELSLTLTPEWPDPPIDTSWTPVSPTLFERVNTAAGLVAERFAICLALPIGEVTQLCEALRPSGYRPFHITSWASADQIVASIVWTRDGAEWKIAGPVPPADALRLDEEYHRLGLHPVVLDAVPPQGESVCVVWAPLAIKLADSQYGARNPAELKATDAPLALPTSWTIRIFDRLSDDDKNSAPDVATTVGNRSPIFESRMPALEVDNSTTRFRDIVLLAEADFDVLSGAYHLWAVGDDGIRVYLDGTLVIDKWEENDMRPHVIDTTLTAGKHHIKVEHFQRTAQMTVKVRLGLPTIVIEEKPGDFSNVPPGANAPFDRINITDATTDGAINQLVEKCRENFRPVRAKDPVVTSGTLKQLEVVLRKPAISEYFKDGLALRQSRAAIAIARLGSSDILWPLLSFTPAPGAMDSQDPRRRTELVNDIAKYHIDWRDVVSQIERIGQEMEHDELAISTRISTQRALILVLGGYTDALSKDERRQIAKQLDLFSIAANHPDPGVHGSVDWLLRMWGLDAKPEEHGDQIAVSPTGENSRWFVNSQGQTFTIIKPAEFRMGSPVSEPFRRIEEHQHTRVIERSFAIAATEVTRRQYIQFEKSTGAAPKTNEELDLSNAFDSIDTPQTGVTWYEAAHYCNWLSEMEGLQLCYVPASGNSYGPGMRSHDDFLERSGYRLPTEAEWEYACRAGSATARFYGFSDHRLGSYAWYATNSSKRTWPVALKMPNDLGLFDMLGNADEWCHDGGFPYYQGSGTVPTLPAIAAGMEETIRRVKRGGDAFVPSEALRAAFRHTLHPDAVVISVSFRPVRTLR